MFHLETDENESFAVRLWAEDCLIVTHSRNGQFVEIATVKNKNEALNWIKARVY